MSQKLRQLEARERQIELALSDIRQKIRLEHLKIVKGKYGVEIGSIVSSMGKKYKVFGIRTNYVRHNSCPKPWLSGLLIKKNGTVGIKKVTLYEDWELVKK